MPVDNEMPEWVRQEIVDAREVVDSKAHGRLRLVSERTTIWLADALDAARAWRPIETAPRDGTIVLCAYRLNGETWAMDAMYWDAEFHTTYLDEEADDAVHTGAWTDGSIDANEDPMEFRPSHWMPLPAPPESTT